jgi:ATP-dependent HslUV protease ATP-binding subunit HslU
MMSSEKVELSFTDGAIREIARVAHETNRTVENIGARRLHTVIERVVEDASFDAPDNVGQKVEIDEAYVKARVSELLLSTDLKKYIL